MIFLKKGIIFLFAFTSFTFVEALATTTEAAVWYDYYDRTITCENENESGADCFYQVNYRPQYGYRQVDMTENQKKDHCRSYIKNKIVQYHINKTEEKLAAAFRREASGDEFDPSEESSESNNSTPVTSIFETSVDYPRQGTPVESNTFLKLEYSSSFMNFRVQLDGMSFHIPESNLLRTIELKTTVLQHSTFQNIRGRIQFTNPDEYKLKVVLEEDAIAYGILGEPLSSFGEGNVPYNMRCNFRVNYQEFNPSGIWENAETKRTLEF